VKACSRLATSYVFVCEVGYMVIVFTTTERETGVKNEVLYVNVPGIKQSV